MVVRLMCDFDGTLAPLVSRPDRVRLPLQMKNLLAKLAADDRFRVAIISGRPLNDLQRLAPVKGLWLSGLHGMEVCDPGGRVTLLANPEGLEALLEGVRETARQVAAYVPGSWVENKGLAVAFHYREAGPAGLSAAEDFTSQVTPFVAGTRRLQLLRGKAVVEVRPAEATKGTAVRYFRNIWPAGPPVYLGDDTTDEDAFQELLSEQGWSFTFLVLEKYRGQSGSSIPGSNPPPLWFAVKPDRPPTAAKFFLGGEAGVYWLLEGLVMEGQHFLLKFQAREDA